MRRSRRWAVGLVGLAGALATAACGSASSTASSTASAPPSTVLDGTAKLVVPFTADNDALVVTAGPAPADVTEADALAVAHQLEQDYPDHPTTFQAFAGTVHLAAGLGSIDVAAPPLDDVPAWVVVYQQFGMASCPAQTGDEPTTTTPSWASHLTALIIIGPAPASQVTATPGSFDDPNVISYHGAGTGVCETLIAPTAWVPPKVVVTTSG